MIADDIRPKVDDIIVVEAEIYALGHLLTPYSRQFDSLRLIIQCVMFCITLSMCS
jgi:hypothetical protein